MFFKKEIFVEKGISVENCRCLKYDVLPLDTSITIDVQQREIFI